MIDPFTRKRRERARQSALELCAKMGLTVVGSGVRDDGKVWLEVVADEDDESDGSIDPPSDEGADRE